MTLLLNERRHVRFHQPLRVKEARNSRLDRPGIPEDGAVSSKATRMVNGMKLGVTLPNYSRRRVDRWPRSCALIHLQAPNFHGEGG